MRAVQTRLLENRVDPSRLSGEEQLRLEEELRRLVSRNGPFTALVRSRVSDLFHYLFD